MKYFLSIMGIWLSFYASAQSLRWEQSKTTLMQGMPIRVQLIGKDIRVPSARLLEDILAQIERAGCSVEVIPLKISVTDSLSEQLLADLYLMPYRVGKQNISFSPIFQGKQKFYPSPLSFETHAQPATPLLEAHTIGRFQLEANISDTHPDINDPITVKITVSGEGDIRHLPKPTFESSEGLISEEPAISQSVQKGDSGIFGKKEYVFEIYAEKEGEYNLGPFTLHYFHAGSGKYQSLESPIWKISVQGEREEDLLALERENFYQESLKSSSAQKHLPSDTLQYMQIAIFALSILGILWILWRKIRKGD